MFLHELRNGVDRSAEGHRSAGRSPR
jgi:hypothetical protein